MRRRYREFHALHTRLKEMGAVLAELPSKSPFGSMTSTVRAREKVLSHSKCLQIKSQFPHKSVNLSCTIPDIKNYLKNLCGD